MFIKLIRIGRDCELRYTSSGTPVCEIVGAYDIGYGDKKRTQWVIGSLWGKKAESLAQYLTKGKQLLMTADDMEVEMYQKQDGTQNCKLKCRVIDIEFAGGSDKPQGAAQTPQQGVNNLAQAQPQFAPQQPVQQQSKLPDDFDDSIPF